MLISILNICSKEELEEDEEDDFVFADNGSRIGGSSALYDQAGDDLSERRTVIKNKILAVGRMSRVFHVLREEAERVSELKMASGTGKLPYGTLVLGSEGIKDVIHNFDEARKVDIENERMPPAIVPVPTTTDYHASPAPAVPGALANTPTPSYPTLEQRTPPTHRRTHSRTSSFGTTMTSPSNRRRPIESTVSMIKEVLEHGTGSYSRNSSPSSSRPNSPRR